MVLSQVSSVGELLAIWEQFPGFADFFNPEDRRKQVALFAGALVAGKAEAFHGRFGLSTMAVKNMTQNSCVQERSFNKHITRDV